MSDCLIIHDRMLVVDSINLDDDLINNMRDTVFPLYVYGTFLDTHGQLKP